MASLVRSWFAWISRQTNAEYLPIGGPDTFGNCVEYRIEGLIGSTLNRTVSRTARFVLGVLGRGPKKEIT